jgi:translation initiation factor eIF-2B subunit epsilon
MGKNKAKAGGGGGGSSSRDDADDRKRHEQPLQAVLLADDYDGTGGISSSGFAPLSLDRPKILCPLLNAPLIEYAIQYLASQGVKELHVVCVTEAVELYLAHRREGGGGSGGGGRNRAKAAVAAAPSHDMKITVLRDTSVTNAGDALRELDKRNVIQSDPFLLMHSGGDAILANCDLRQAMMEHRERHKRDGSAILTMLLKPIGSAGLRLHRNGTAREDLVVGIDPAQHNRILVYVDNNTSDASVPVPCSFFANHCTRLELRTDLLDVGLDLCSPDVLARFSDEFDYRDIRREFVSNSVAEEEEGLQNRLYAHILDEHRAPNGIGTTVATTSNSEYAARIHDVRTYHTIARDILRRYAYPIVPDDNDCLASTRGEDGPKYQLQRHFMYYESTGKTRVGRSSAIKGPGMIGKNCYVGEECQILESVLGEHCHVADRCRIVESHLWEGVQVEEGAFIQQSVLADGVIVKAGAVVSRGCIVGAGCVVGSNVRLPEFTRLTCVEPVQSDDDGNEDWDESSGGSDKAEEEESDRGDKELPSLTKEKGLISDTAIVGADGRGRVWQPPLEDDVDDDDSEEENTIPLEDGLRSECIGFDPATIFAKRSKFEDDDSFSVVDAFDNPALDEYADGGGVDFGDGPVPGNLQGSVIIGRQEGVDVVKELKMICLEFESSTSPIENLAIELNSYKFSQNASYSDCTMAATLALMEEMHIVKGSTDGKLVSDFKAHLDRWGPLLQRMSIGLEEEKAIVLALEMCAVGDTTTDDSESAKEMSAVLSSGMSFRLLLQMLHDQEIVSEESVLAWAADRKEADGDKDTPRGRLYRLEPVQKFLEWLDEESDDEEDDDDAGDSDDEN